MGSSSSSSSPSSSPSSSSRRSKRGNPEKPKQPQRGLGVAQLEKIRLHEEMGCCFNLPSTNFIHMGLTEYGTTNILYEDHPQSTSTASWRPNNQDMSASFQFSQSNIDNKQFVNPNLEGSWERRSKTRLISDPFGSSSQNSSESSDNNQEVDLELRLSL
ncbi:hypothetical protein CRG98_003378 [Punica granatum]|uniref:Protein SPEAR1-like n=1 Tax=Punica granatum TaxID=22663 RepID=A0A2I0L6D5_PUNGR|nr:hypothetical protein CRG98_003378 [Punica granatum]